MGDRAEPLRTGTHRTGSCGCLASLESSQPSHCHGNGDFLQARLLCVYLSGLGVADLGSNTISATLEVQVPFPSKPLSNYLQQRGTMMAPFYKAKGQKLSKLDKKSHPPKAQSCTHTAQTDVRCTILGWWGRRSVPRRGRLDSCCFR